MKGNKVEISLNTPILIEVHEGEGAHKSREEAVTRILGTVLEVSEAGLTVEWSELYNERKQKLAPPRRWVFLPLFKIDHCTSVS
ncbi:hypothetical protein F9K50_05555 [bacterium]|nr:MAG: hypothetical protein F9K50_05555 [bacterium]